jgi:hypothetical protein
MHLLIAPFRLLYRIARNILFGTVLYCTVPLLEIGGETFSRSGSNRAREVLWVPAFSDC